MYLLMVFAAAFCFSIGGMYMKLSQGLSLLIPSLLVYTFFYAGASLQTLATNKSDLGGTYIFVLGLESVLTLLIGAMLFQENYSPLKLVGISLVVAGIIFLRTGNS